MSTKQLREFIKIVRIYECKVNGSSHIHFSDLEDIMQSEMMKSFIKKVTTKEGQ